MKRVYFWCILFISIFIIWNCNKLEENEPEYTSNSFVFYSLISEKDSIVVGETTKIKAKAQGNQLKYYWSATEGIILGSGDEVIYTAAVCGIGENKITCEIFYAKNQSESKTIEIIVYE